MLMLAQKSYWKKNCLRYKSSHCDIAVTITAKASARLMKQITPYVCFGIMNADVLISPGQTGDIWKVN